jgi:hypothetical protein
MVDTNALLSIAFAVISNFSTKVQIPPGSVPRNVGEVQRILIGSPLCPIDVYMALGEGTQFTMEHGVIQHFRSQNSFLTYHEPFSKFVGTSILSSNQVVQLTAETLMRLERHGHPLSDAVPVVYYAGPRYAQLLQGKEIPFWEVSWRNPREHMENMAVVEVDGRSGDIVSLNLYDWGFFDTAFELEISNRVYTADATPARPKPPPGKRVLPPPTAEQASSAIEHWRGFCRGLGIAIPPETALSDVDWDRSLVVTDRVVSASTPVCRIVFKNGVLFDSVGELVYNHYGKGCFFIGDVPKKPKAEWKAMEGTVMKDWHDLARSLQVRVAEYLGSLSSELSTARPFVVEAGGGLGTNGLTRTVIEWRKYHRPDHTIDAQELPLLFAAEFDLRSGDTVWVNFQDIGLLGWKEPRPSSSGPGRR